MRDNRIDNFKGILIYLVVLGHLLEISGTGTLGNITYKAIYSFHMPAFMFLMGMVRKPNVKQIKKDLIIYLLFQLLYVSFDAMLFNKPLTISYLVPYWILWFTLVEIYYGIVLILIKMVNVNIKWLFAVSIAISLVAGYISRIGYSLSLSRAITFFPYFVGGMIFKEFKDKIHKYFFAGAAAVLCTLISIFVIKVNDSMLYGSFSYNASGANPIIRLFIYVVAFTDILAIYMYLPNKEMPFVNGIGKSTLYIYLLHGFIILLIKRFNFFVYNPIVNYLIALSLSFVIVLLLSRVNKVWV